MTFRPLPIPPGTPTDLERLVRERIDPQLRDVHAMLRLPMNDIPGLDGGCTFPVTSSLLDIVSGVSWELYIDPNERDGRPRKYNDNRNRFIKVLEEHFPWSQEPNTGEEIIGGDASKTLWDAYRNPLTHNLGNVHNQTYGGVFKIAKGDLSEEEIEVIEQAPTRPPEWTHPTLRRVMDGDEGERKLTVKCFYWGVRHMIGEVLAVCARHALQQQKYPPSHIENFAEVTASATHSLPKIPPISNVSSGSTE